MRRRYRYNLPTPGNKNQDILRNRGWCEAPNDLDGFIAMGTQGNFGPQGLALS